MRRVLALVGVCFISCNVIQGDLERLLDDPYQIAYNPRWSADASRILFISEPNNTVQSFELSTGVETEVFDQKTWFFETSSRDNLAITQDLYMFNIRDIETWEVVDSCEPCEESKWVWGALEKPQFSYETAEMIYYIYWVEPDSLFIHRINYINDSDERIISTCGSGKVFAPGSGDTLIALNDTIYNLKSGEKIPTKILPQTLHWNPANPNELLIATGEDNDLYIFDVETRKLHRINMGLERDYYAMDARFSPDGSSIVLEGTLWGDGQYEQYLWLYILSD